MLLLFAFLMKDDQPGLSGIIVAAGVGSWFQKNAAPPPPASIAQAAALAAAEVIRTANAQARQAAQDAPDEVEIVGEVNVASPAPTDRL